VILENCKVVLPIRTGKECGIEDKNQRNQWEVLVDIHTYDESIGSLKYAVHDSNSRFTNICKYS